MSLPAILLPVVKYLSIISFFISFITSCQGGPKDTGDGMNSEFRPKKEFVLETPVPDEVISLNDTIVFAINPLRKAIPDSVSIFIEGNFAHTEKSSPLSFVTHNVFLKVGRQNIRIVVFHSDSLTQTLTSRVTVLSDIEPRVLSYRLVRNIPHNTNDFIQGFVYFKGHLYEGTGREGFSSLKKKNPVNGDTELERKMDKTFFGEGITILHDKIYQLTYRQKVGFVYDVTTFEMIREFDLQTMEGWGLTTDGKNLIVSDGSPVLYFYDPEYFNQVKQLDVCNNKGLVTSLNELEYVDGAIWANIYGQSIIVKIDSETGKVIARLDLEALFPVNMPRDYDHVLNGIAYNPDKNTFYITGKLWPVMYEIVIEEKPDRK